MNKKLLRLWNLILLILVILILSLILFLIRESNDSSPKDNLTPLPNDEESCLDIGGEWRAFGIGNPQCNLRTSDAGKKCSSSDQCEGQCILDVSWSSNYKTLWDIRKNANGKCAEWRMTFGCFVTPEAAICVD